MSDHCCESKGVELERLARQADQRRVLIIVLIINAGMFFAEFGAGLVAGSAALMADATDMLADAFVFGLSLYAVARSDRWKAGVAAFKGALILVLGLGILVNVAIKIQSGVPPSSSLMLIFGERALVAKFVSVGLLWRFRAQDVNMATTFECCEMKSFRTRRLMRRGWWRDELCLARTRIRTGDGRRRAAVGRDNAWR